MSQGWIKALGLFDSFVYINENKWEVKKWLKLWHKTWVGREVLKKWMKGFEEEKGRF